MSNPRDISLAITGASGAVYAQRLLQTLLAADIRVHLMLSAAGRIVCADELNWKLPARASDIHKMLVTEFGCAPDLLQVYGEQQWSAPVASGGHTIETMIVCPCTMGTLSAIAIGSSNNLIHRAADVMIKEQRKLILLPREMPFSAIHLENMLKLSRLGVVIMPPNPGFYFQPTSVDELVDFVVSRVLDQAGVANNLAPRWGVATEIETVIT